MQIAVRGDDRALAIRGQLLLELHYLDIRRQSAERHNLPDVVRGCIKRAYLIHKLLDGPDGPLNDQVVSHPWFQLISLMRIRMRVATCSSNDIRQVMQSLQYALNKTRRST